MTTQDKIRRVVLVLVFLAGGVGFVLVVNSTRDVDDTGEFVEEQQGPEGVLESGAVDAAPTTNPDAVGSVSEGSGIVEGLIPSEGNTVTRQSQISINLAPGYDARLYVNGEAIGPDQITRRPDTNEVFFTPAPDQLSGRVRMRAEIFSLDDGAVVGNEEWSFNVN